MNRVKLNAPAKNELEPGRIIHCKDATPLYIFARFRGEDYAVSLIDGTPYPIKQLSEWVALDAGSSVEIIA